jgi:hypothetical protein
MKTQVINIAGRHNLNAIPGYVYVGRPGKWGNPFHLGKDGDRAEVLRKYEAWLTAYPEQIEAVKRELRGKTLGCWCHPRPCHGHILARIANE